MSATAVALYDFGYRVGYWLGFQIGVAIAATCDLFKGEGGSP